MKLFRSLSDVCEIAISLSRGSNAIVGVFQKKSGEYYASFSANEISLSDAFVAQYHGGELLKIMP